MTVQKEQRRLERLAKSLKLRTPPSFSDPRIHRRAEKVLEFAYDLMFVPQGQQALHSKEYYKIIGTIGRGPAAYFDTLFAKVGSYSKGSPAKAGQTYKYRPRRDRVQRCADAAGYTDGLLKAAARAGRSFRTAPGPRAQLPRTGDRVYPWWALMPSDIRKELFVLEHGKGFDYDIEAAKPTVTLQAWEKLFPEAPVLKTWRRLVNDRKTFRQELADAAGITEDQAKFVCQVVLNGSWASPVSKNGICERIGEAGTRRVMESKLYQNLRADFKIFWDYLKDSGTIPAGLEVGAACSRFYNQIEDEIMNVVAEELKTQDVWFIHDGFMTSTEINRTALQEVVKFKTGYDIRFDQTDLCNSV